MPQSNMQIIEYTLKDIDLVAQQLQKMTDGCAIMTFTGSLGAGKTTLVKALLERLGVQELVTSPTFTYVNVYNTLAGTTIYHFDLYRIDSLQTFVHAGFDEYLYQPNSIVMIEWPEHIMPLITHKACHIGIEYKDEETRILQQRLMS